MSQDNSEVSGPSREPSRNSSQNSRAGPAPNILELDRYVRLLSPAVPWYSSRREDLSLVDWEAAISIWMDNHLIPHQYRVRVGSMRLKGPAATAWNQVADQFGPELTWDAFINIIDDEFTYAELSRHWDDFTRTFQQSFGEGIQAYGRRFQEAIVERYPYGVMSEETKKIIYMRGLQPYFRIPQPPSRYLTFAALRAAHEAYDDVDFFPTGRVPQARTPRQMPPAAPAPANPAEQSEESDSDPNSENELEEESESETEDDRDDSDEDYDPAQDP